MRISIGSIGVAAALSLASWASAASAEGLYRDRVHADSFGNLVIHSPAGYKRIVVGAGHLADAYRAEDLPEVIYFDDSEFVRQNRHVRRCNRQPVLLHGRSYMYGLPDNVVPVPAGICE